MAAGAGTGPGLVNSWLRVHRALPGPQHRTDHPTQVICALVPGAGRIPRIEQAGRHDDDDPAEQPRSSLARWAIPARLSGRPTA
ncbi:MAG TPA: hypothetical protein VN597_10520, partial [Streptosporangiaceae bacterium]|nr:hypothetical protein [Streptosporangiaceae bacterium]